jgi:hypothetical protein
MAERHPALERLEDQIDWYDRRSASNQRHFKVMRAAALVLGASVPILALTDAHKFAIAAVGFALVVLEGLQQLNQYYANWISYRSTCEALKHEKFLFLAKSGPYAQAADPLVLLAERVEALVSQEHAKWVSVQRKAAELKEETPKS